MNLSKIMHWDMVWNFSFHQ